MQFRGDFFLHLMIGWCSAVHFYVLLFTVSLKKNSPIVKVSQCIIIFIDFSEHPINKMINDNLMSFYLNINYMCGNLLLCLLLFREDVSLEVEKKATERQEDNEGM